MTNTHLYIRNMCCSRCIEIVKGMFKNSAYKLASVKVGEIVLQKKLTEADFEKIETLLKTRDFSIAERHAEKMVVQIHALLCHYVRENLIKGSKSTKLSAYLETEMHRSYYHLSKLFSTQTGLTIERYFLLLKMEKAKELLMEGVESITAIAWQLGYGSLQTFSTQFKKETGKTPGAYRLHPEPSRLHWDEVLPQHFKQMK